MVVCNKTYFSHALDRKFWQNFKKITFCKLTICHAISINVYIFSNRSIWFKVPIRPIDTNCNFIWWIEFGSCLSPIGWIELHRNACYEEIEEIMWSVSFYPVTVNGWMFSEPLLVNFLWKMYKYCIHFRTESESHHRHLYLGIFSQIFLKVNFEKKMQKNPTFLHWKEISQFWLLSTK